jgi:hypothetical protein
MDEAYTVYEREFSFESIKGSSLRTYSLLRFDGLLMKGRDCSNTLSTVLTNFPAKYIVSGNVTVELAVPAPPPGSEDVVVGPPGLDEFKGRLVLNRDASRAAVTENLDTAQVVLRLVAVARARGYVTISELPF